MAYTQRLSTAAVNAEADAVANLLSLGALRIYDGTQPASADAPVTDQVLLAELRFDAPAFLPAVEGTATARAMTPDESAAATGRASWCRVVTAAGVVLFDGSVGTGRHNLVVNQVEIEAGALVRAEVFEFTARKV